MTSDAYVKMVTFYVHAASSLQELSEKNMKYFSVHHDIKNNDYYNNNNNNNNKN